MEQEKNIIMLVSQLHISFLGVLYNRLWKRRKPQPDSLHTIVLLSSYFCPAVFILLSCCSHIIVPLFAYYCPAVCILLRHYVFTPPRKKCPSGETSCELSGLNPVKHVETKSFISNCSHDKLYYLCNAKNPHQASAKRGIVSIPDDGMRILACPVCNTTFIVLAITQCHKEQKT